MDESLRAQIELYLPRLQALIRRGYELRDALVADPASRTALATNRIWQQDCGVAVNELSGGSKAHWLARAFSESFLLRRANGGAALEGAEPAVIVERLVDVLKRAAASLAQLGDDPALAAASMPGTPAPRRFEFVHNAELRSVLEQAYAGSRDALEEGRYGDALLSACGILEAIVTDALEHAAPDAFSAAGAPSGNLKDWPFNTRLAVAEKAGLIRGGCARLPLVARHYRDRDDHDLAAVSERDARVAGQVLRVVMRDLDPGR